RSRFYYTFGGDVDGVDRGARGDEQTVLPLAAEAQIGTGLRQVDLADQLAGRGIATHTVLLRIGPPHAAPHIAVRVEPHPIGDARCEVLGEDLAVGQLVFIVVEEPDVCRVAQGGGAGDVVWCFFFCFTRQALW